MKLKEFLNNYGKQIKCKVVIMEENEERYNDYLDDKRVYEYLQEMQIAEIDTSNNNLVITVRENLQKICDEHNFNEVFKGNKKPSEKFIKLLQTNKEELLKWTERCSWHCNKAIELNEILKWIKKQYDNDFTEDELNNLQPRDKAIYEILKEKIID